MRVVSKEDFLSKKKSDTVIIYGSGPTISSLTKEEKDKLNSIDSIGFNWFCKSSIPTTFYTIREQATTSKRVSKKMGITPQHLIDFMNSDYYIDTCLVMHDMSGFPNHDFVYSDHLDEFKGHGVMVKELKRKIDVPKKFDVRYYNKDIFDDGVYHGHCSLSNAIHIAIGMGYQEIVFVGVDLYDSRYFWRGDKKYLLINDVKEPHKVGDPTIKMIRSINKRSLIKMYSYNKKSLLSKFLDVWGDKV